MAQSPAHKFGQIIGNLLEAAIEPSLQAFASEHNLFLDKKGPRPARHGSKIPWTDRYGNQHDLDFVLEKDGSPELVGTPVAFIESAWRRYTKHSTNKSQEIQGAILPLRETHQHTVRFVGAVLAGVFTEGALRQLRSLGFCVLYFPYEAVIRAFAHVRIDAQFGESTSDRELSRRVRAWDTLAPSRRLAVSEALLDISSAQVREFMASLTNSITRRIESVRVLPLHGTPRELTSVGQAISFIVDYKENSDSMPLSKYEVQVRYSNGDRIEAQFQDKASAVSFLNTLDGSAS